VGDLVKRRLCIGLFKHSEREAYGAASEMRKDGLALAY